MPYISRYFDGPVHGIFATDALETKNFKADDQGLDELTSPHVNINTGDRIYALYRFHSAVSVSNVKTFFRSTGMYFLRHWEGGKKFFEAWFSQKSMGHDQDGFNAMSRYAGVQPLMALIKQISMLTRLPIRGREYRGDEKLPSSFPGVRHGQRMFACALDNSTLISFLPISMFGNAYT